MKKISILLLAGLFLWGCSQEGEPEVKNEDNFDRSAMLQNWADNIIIPAYETYVAELSELTQAKNAFVTKSDLSSFQALKTQWLEAYIAWQRVSMFEIGKAEELTLRDYTNIFPTDAEEIEENITSGQYNLELPSTRAQQGFPALDYLLHGSAESEATILARFEGNPAMMTYLSDLADRLEMLSTQVLDDWKSGYRDTFIASDGSNASSSVNKFLNDFLFYYEKALRAGKIGIPAGVFSNTPLSDRVEALYKRDASKVLFETALQAVVDFFNGRHFNENATGESLVNYLDFLNTITQGESLSALINDQFQEAIDAGQALDDNFYNEVETNNQAMLKTYDALQANVILMKVDMFQALNIKVDYVDADGD